MGYSISWIGVYQEEQLEIINTSGLDFDSTKHTSHLKHNKSIGELQNGWNVLFFNKNCEDAKFYSKYIISSFLEKEIIICSLEEHVMASYVEKWANGKLLWKISHDASKKNNLEITGELPQKAVEIIQKYKSLQTTADEKNENVDYLIEAPIKVAKLYTEFHHIEENQKKSVNEWNGIEDKNAKGCFQVILLLTVAAVAYAIYKTWG